MSQPAIVVIAYDRPEALNSLLQNLAKCDYPNEVQLIISIDGEGDKKVPQIADDFSWNFGEKVVLKNDENLGLKKHVLKCGDLTEKYGPIIMLEDDLEVSPQFYKYALDVLKNYDADRDVLAGFSLYSYQVAETALRPMYHLKDDQHELYLMKYPSSWGQIFTPGQWTDFRQWQQKNSKTDVPLPAYVRSWSGGSWKKDLLRYLIAEEKFILHPYSSYSTNKGLAGANLAMNVTVFDVPLTNTLPAAYPDLSLLARYDEYFELSSSMLLFNDLLEGETLDLDIYGTKHMRQLKVDNVITTRKPRKGRKVTHLDTTMLNLEGVLDEDLKLGKPNDFVQKPRVPLMEHLIYADKVKHGELKLGALSWLGFVAKYRIRNYFKVLIKALRGK